MEAFWWVSVVAVLLAVLGIPVAGMMLAAWVLRPVDRAARLRQAPPQFTLADFLCLFFLAALPTGCLRWLAGGTDNSGVGCFAVFAWTACGLLWWTAVQSLSRAGITDTWHRAAFVALVVPTAVVTSVAVPLLTLLILAHAVGEMDFVRSGLERAVFADAGLVLAAYGCGRYTRWLVSARGGGVLLGDVGQASDGLPFEHAAHGQQRVSGAQAEPPEGLGLGDAGQPEQLAPLALEDEVARAEPRLAREDLHVDGVEGVEGHGGPLGGGNPFQDHDAAVGEPIAPADAGREAPEV